ncbi:hypothetical protein PhCBS80983_g03698 [Powellomyces hirtus]|uniref:Mitochondrial carrier protein n=1 Tax=Powellomyces hirtus TaxID=109895 RepID=A0A507E1K7_9FUNG|nr:hypothetical protein PhCBS80983_g03698 [Powellomyces hirtus]
MSTIFRREGPRGEQHNVYYILCAASEHAAALYQGFTITALGALPGQIIYLSAMESTKMLVANACRDLFHLDENRTALVSGLLGGGVASLSTQLVVVPVDVVSQRLMIQQRTMKVAADGRQEAKVGTARPPMKDAERFTTARTLIPHIIKTEGVRGLYRGFFMSVATYAPSSAVWWGTQSFVKRFLGSALYSSEAIDAGSILPAEHIASQFSLAAVSGATAGIVAAFATNPMDVVKTRIQTRETNGLRQSEFKLFTSTCRDMLNQEGWRGFTRGLGARIVNMGLTSMLMITTYETVKRLSFRDRPIE